MIEYHLRPNRLREGLAGDAIKYEGGEFLPPLVPRWTLIVIDINLFWIVLLLDPQGF